jgi:DNA-binding MarR family transcriptional regulator
MWSAETELIERQLTLLLRRVQHMHGLSAPDGTHGGDGTHGTDLDRSGYGILSRIADSGPQRLSALARAFGLDPSTITRQVQALESQGLLERQRDPRDRRASLLRLTETGHARLGDTRRLRVQRLRDAMSAWSAEDRSTFGRLLADFNEAVGRTVPAHGGDPEPS